MASAVCGDGRTCDRGVVVMTSLGDWDLWVDNWKRREGQLRKEGKGREGKGR